MDKEFSITVKLIRIEGFENAVLNVTIRHDEKEYMQEKVVELPLFKNIGQKIIEQVLYETFWLLRKEWEPRNPEEFSMYKEDLPTQDKPLEEPVDDIPQEDLVPQEPLPEDVA